VDHGQAGRLSANPRGGHAARHRAVQRARGQLTAEARAASGRLMSDTTPGYRPGVGIMLLNRAGEVFVGRRIDMPAMPAWQMPQGGIDPGETPLQAALRELKEEIGTAKAELLAESQHWLKYDLPAGLARDIWGGRYRGQQQKWFAMRFIGDDSDI